jgi:hypothetical protein
MLWQESSKQGLNAVGSGDAMRRCGIPDRFAAQHECGQASLPWADRDCSTRGSYPHSQIFYGCRKRACGSSADSRLVFAASFPDRPEIIERAAIRIRSEHKWPKRVVLDASQPTIAPPAVEEPPAAQSVQLPPDDAGDQSNLEAVAQLKPDTQPVAIDRPTLQIKRGVARRPDQGV